MPAPVALRVNTINFDDIKWETADLDALEAANDRPGGIQLGIIGTPKELRKVSYEENLDMKVDNSDAQWIVLCRQKTRVEKELKIVTKFLKQAVFVLRLQILLQENRGETTTLCDEMSKVLGEITDMMKILTGDDFKKVPVGDWSGFVEVMKYLQDKVMTQFDGKVTKQFGLQGARDLKSKVRLLLNRFP
jgi:hypothetical protein